jgi:pimeloyl-ACP methyl ester carboxylesterase
MAELSLCKQNARVVDAPQKEYVLLNAGGHFALFTHPTEFLDELVKRVRPLAVGAQK